jgi:3-deoxy-D-manno-octulosonate 8-phosphate phosphatase (KDO 8-P phosphatase)
MLAKSHVESVVTAEQRAARLQLMVLDVDGVLTDGRLYYGPQGEAMKVFDVRDGHGIKMLFKHGVEVALLSARSSDIVSARARELKISRVLQGRSDKGTAFAMLLSEASIRAENSGFMGDDLPDLPPMRAAGFAATVADGCDAAQTAAHWISPHPGGRGAVRALAEFILRAKGISDESMVLG